jgi:hypothetical protein
VTLTPTRSVCRVFIFKDTGVQPHLSVGLISVRPGQKGGLPGPGRPDPPTVIPVPVTGHSQAPGAPRLGTNIR